MYKIHVYKDKNGREPITEYLHELAMHKGKDARIKLNKIDEYMQKLSEKGLALGMPYIRPLEGNIWELRPLRDRFLFAAWSEDGGFVLLHYFTKKTQKTPPREIEQAKRELKDLLERGVTYD